MSSHPNGPGYWRENFRRSLQDWEGRQRLGGLLVLLVTALGYGVVFNEPTVVRLAAIGSVALVAALVFIFSPWAMWRDAQVALAAQRERLTPRLAFVFEADVPPYLQHFVFQQAGRKDRRVRMCRVGIRNDSDAVIPRVRVVVESATYIHDGAVLRNSPNSPAPIEHALNVMGIDEKPGYVDLSPGDLPTMFIDVCEQFRGFENDGKLSPGADPWMSLCYASGHRVEMHARAKWIVGLRAEGGGTYTRARVEIEASEEEQDIVMRPIGFGAGNAREDGAHAGGLQEVERGR